MSSDGVGQRLSHRQPRDEPATAIAAPHPDSRTYAKRFSGKYEHRLIAGAGHNLPQETPAAFIEAILDADSFAG